MKIGKTCKKSTKIDPKAGYLKQLIYCIWCNIQPILCIG